MTTLPSTMRETERRNVSDKMLDGTNFSRLRLECQKDVEGEEGEGGRDP